MPRRSRQNQVTSKNNVVVVADVPEHFCCNKVDAVERQNQSSVAILDRHGRSNATRHTIVDADVAERRVRHSVARQGVADASVIERHGHSSVVEMSRQNPMMRVVQDPMDLESRSKQSRPHRRRFEKFLLNSLNGLGLG